MWPASKTTGCARVYLIGYNTVAFACWMWVCVVLLSFKHSQNALKQPLNPAKLWEELALPLKVAQTLSLLECLHSLLGLVRSSLFPTTVQVVSRLHIVWIIWRLVPEGRQTNALILTVVAWTLTELIRYAFYAFQNVFSSVWFPVVWLRYTIFIVTYPLGILGEVLSIWASLDYLRDTPALRAYPVPMPNMFNFQLDLFTLYSVMLLVYLPGGVYLYRHMLDRRTKVLGSVPSQDVQKVE